MERKRLLRLGVITLMGVSGVIGGVHYTTELLRLTNEVFTPRVVYRGNPAPPMDEKPEWVRPTDWRRTIVTERGK